MQATFNKEAFQSELLAILDFWRTNVYVQQGNYFHPRLDENGAPDDESPLGAVYMARILWSFSAAFKRTGREIDRSMADRAYEVFIAKLVDHQYGGVFWSVNLAGVVTNGRKQIYAQAFAIYGLSAYYEVTKKEEARNLAIALFDKIERHSFDNSSGGYLEAFNREWGIIADMRLSNKDENAPKTMNTHLHILEAYTALYKIWPDESLEKQLERLLNDFLLHMYDERENSLHLFLAEDWQPTSNVRSFGHDIEAAWLLMEAVAALGKTAVAAQIRDMAVALAFGTEQGICEYGALYYELDKQWGHLNREKHWWVQAEAMVGFYKAYQWTGNEKFKSHASRLWSYIQTEVKDHQLGEWFWGRDGNGAIMKGQDKAGFWKCPYHNSRSCLELWKESDLDTF